MSEYQRTRDARVKAMYEFTCQLATLESPSPEMQQLFGAIHGNQKAMDDFARMNVGTISPAEFFAPENVNAITAAAQGQGRAMTSSSPEPIERSGRLLGSGRRKQCGLQGRRPVFDLAGLIRRSEKACERAARHPTLLHTGSLLRPTNVFQSAITVFVEASPRDASARPALLFQERRTATPDRYPSSRP